MQVRTRYAPTPSGYLHIGNIFSFIYTWLITRKLKGHVMLRIDDMDHQRIEMKYLDGIFRTLDWLKLDYDTGPAGVEDFNINFSQKNRMDIYTNGLKRFMNDSKTLFYCTCSRKMIRENSITGLYPGTCRENYSKRPDSCIRLNTSINSQVEIEDALKGGLDVDVDNEMRDFVVWKKDNCPSYQLASLLDDEFFDINFIVRGKDLLPSTAAQLFLSKQIKGNNFDQSKFVHHDLLYHEGMKISKSQHSNSVLEQFNTPKHVYIYVGKLLGLNSRQSESLSILLENFNPNLNV